MIDPSIVAGYHADLPSALRLHLNARHISDDIINTLQIGFAVIHEQNWIVIPIPDIQGNTMFLKLKRPPDAPDSQPKGMTFPASTKEDPVEATLYPRPYLTSTTDEIVVCEGEPDALSLLSHGINAITSTAGANTFREEWLEAFPTGCRVILCFDLDEAGQEGLKKVKQLFEEKRSDVRLGVVNHTAALRRWGKDVTDWFTNPLLFPKDGLPPEIPQNT